jgi:hypothetical protein
VAPASGLPGARGLTSPFYGFSEGSVSPKFHPRRDRNRVFYAGSLKEARPWLRFTGLGLDRSFFNRDGVFPEGRGLLAIFYRHLPGGIPQVTSIRTGDGPATLDVGVTLYPSCPAASGGGAPPPCVPSPWDARVSCSPACTVWGRFILESVDKTILPVHPERIRVTEARYVAPPCPCLPPPPPPVAH